MGPWYVYILSDGPQLKMLYVGVTTDIQRRLAQHNAGTGAKFTRGRGPWELLMAMQVPDKSTALRLEYRIKQMSHLKKLELVLKVSDTAPYVGSTLGTAPPATVRSTAGGTVVDSRRPRPKLPKRKKT